MENTKDGPELIELSDRQKEQSRPIPEMIGFTFYHKPGNEHEIDGYRYSIRVGNRSFRVLVLECEGDQSIEKLKPGEV